MKISEILTKAKQRFCMIKTTNQNVKQLLFNQRKYILEQNILHDSTPGISQERYCDHDIIVSLTTYSKRIYDVHLSIESIMEQTMKANRIILWLDYSFENKTLPKALQLLQKKGLEIKYCKDIRSYTKLIPTLKLCPNDAIITIDDDVIYEFDLLENLISSYIKNPSYIYCTRQHLIKKDKNGKLLSYKNWELESSNINANIMNFPTGVGGVLYPPHTLDNEVFNEDVFLNICKYADDVWFKAMSIKKGTLSKKVYTHHNNGNDFIENEIVQDIGLKTINTQGEVLNDKQIQAVFTKYNLYSLLQQCQ
ncbi:glycosyltransferase family A protein [Phocaeicola coprophilus]|uniref:glycosyltransferase family A protein n=1 Tax=Phocaeicola coprophilus TaxID=387090 RepID=UPI00266FE2E1|nr:glycosyltransferase family A protein [Phocaeicola coprophilus]